MKALFPHPALALLALLGLAGCAAPSLRFPSLLPRPSESRDESERVVATAAPAADPALDAQLASLGKALADAATAFPTIATRAARLVPAARQAGTGSDAWLAAQSLLADLDLVRAQGLTTLADIDRLAADRGIAGLPDYPGIEALRASAEAQVKAQGEAIDALQGQLPGA